MNIPTSECILLYQDEFMAGFADAEEIGEMIAQWETDPARVFKYDPASNSFHFLFHDLVEGRVDCLVHAI